MSRAGLYLPVSSAVLALLAPVLVALPSHDRTRPTPAAVFTTDTVHVAPPTGHQEADRASILAALERVRPGETIRFAPGTYLMGELTQAQLMRLTGTFEAQGVPVELTFALDADGLTLTITGQEPARLVPIAPFLFREGAPGSRPPTRCEFELEGGRAVAVTWIFGPDARGRFARRPDQR